MPPKVAVQKLWRSNDMKRKLVHSIAALGIGLIFAAAPASAQVFWKSPAPVTTLATGTEPVLGLNLPGATPAELRAGLVWHLRAALNVAALQCDFEPTLLTVSNYNAAIAHHKAELANSFSTLGSYFQRVKGKGAAGQKALDQYGTRIYSSYSAVQTQRAFCLAAAHAGRDAIFADRGKFYDVAQQNLLNVRQALSGGSGEQMFTNPAHAYRATLPLMTKQCWNKRDELTNSCQQNWEKYVADRSR